LKRAAAALALVLALAAAFVAGRASWRIARGAPVRAAVVARVGGLAEPTAIALPALPDRPVRNLVLAVGDGMGVVQLAAARLRAFGPDGRFVIERLPVTGLVATHPASRLVGKSDSSANALASGVRTLVDRIGMDASGSPLPTVLEAAAAAGLVTGVVTSSQVFDATPAAFYAHVERRGDHAAIVGQLATAPLDLVAGGGRELFSDAALAAARERGVEVALDTAAWAGASRLPLWGLFPGKRLGEEPAHPTVGELAERALALVAAEAGRRGSGFFLLLEEEGIDTASHANSLERLAAATLRFDQAVAHAARFAAADGETLLVVVGDHGTGGLVIEEEKRLGTLRVSWSSAGHSGEPVALFAYGPDAAQRALSGLYDLPELGRRLRAALDLEAR